MSDEGVVITILDNGPYLVKGATEVIDADGKCWDTSGRPSVALCRCGGSDNKPFCDGAHARIEFKAVDRAGG